MQRPTGTSGYRTVSKAYRQAHIFDTRQYRTGFRAIRLNNMREALRIAAESAPRDIAATLLALAAVRNTDELERVLTRIAH